MSASLCEKCGTPKVEVRCVDPNDCGGCETCNRIFGGVKSCQKCASRDDQCENDFDITMVEDAWL